MTAAAVIFALTYIVIGLQKVPRLHIGRPGPSSQAVSNVPAVMLFVPALEALPSVSATHLWLALAAFSTLAGNLTIIGSVANVIVFETARRDGVEIGFLEYLKAGAPLTLATCLLAWGWLAWR